MERQLPLEKNLKGSSTRPAWLIQERAVQAIPLITLSLGAWLWAISLPNVNLRGMTDIGLLAVLPVTFYLALAVVTISFFLAEFEFHSSPLMLGLHLLLMIFILHGTPIILYGPDTMRYSWSWKHLGIIDYIMRHGSVDPYIAFLNAYHNWPGFFAVNALFTETAGLSSALSYARWSQIYNNLFFLGGLAILYRSFTIDRRLIWLAAWFFVILNWVGQDYFAPQAMAYFLYLVTIGILLTWFRSWVGPDSFGLFKRLRLKRLESWASWLFQRSAGDVPRKIADPRQRVLLIEAVILTMAVITFTHQLTPLVLIVSLVLLVLFQRIYMTSIALLMFVFENIWLWFVATPFMAQNLPSMIAALGNLSGNFSQSLISLSSASQGQIIVSLMGRGLTLLAMLLAGIGFLRRVRVGHVDLSAILLAIAPITSLAANSYGGEILFRVYFFALPSLAFLIGGIFYPAGASRDSRLHMVAAIGISLVMLTGFLFAYYGKEKENYISPAEVAASVYLFNTAPPGSLIISGTADYPALIHNYEDYTYVNIAQEPIESRKTVLQDPVRTLDSWMSNPRYTGAFLIITRSQSAAVDMVGSMPTGSLGRIEKALIQSGKFTALYQNQDAVIITLKDRTP